MFRWQIKQCRGTESNQKWGNYTSYLGWSETPTLIWHLNRDLSTVKEQAKQIPREEATSGTALPLRGNGVGAWVQYLINSKEQLRLEGGKGEMIMKLERCWGQMMKELSYVGVPEICACLQSARPLTFLSIHTHPCTVCLRTIRSNPIELPFPATPVLTRRPRPIPWVLFPIWLYTSCFLILPATSPLHHLKHFYCALSNSNQLPTKCPAPSASSVNVHFIWLKQKPEFPQMTLSSL